MTQSQELQSILSGIKVAGKTDKSFEEASLYADIGLGKYIHNFIVKPISYWFSSKILRAKLLEAIGSVKGKRVLDVSCGDDPTILKIADTAFLTYANDMIKESMSPVVDKAGERRIIFMNENLMDLKLKKVDIVICKNTLHHMNTIKQVEKALRKLKRLGKKIIIMDIENPKLSALSRLWNAYYVFLLKDQGGFFIDYAQFCRALQVVFGDRKFKTKRIHTIKGDYMLAIIEQDGNLV